MTPSNETPWPALTIQGTFLGANLAFMLAGNLHPLILISFTVFVVLFAIQTTTGNPRFLYLYPVNTKTGDPSSGLDTEILRWMILIGVFFFFGGATKSLLGAVFVLLVSCQQSSVG